MSKLEIPTDNLYKFIAIAGVTLAIASILALTAVLTGPDKLIEAAIKDAHKYVALVDKQSVTKTELTPEDTSKLFSLEASVKSYNEILEYRKFGSTIAFYCLLGSTLLGIIMTGLGFFFWYGKLQKHLDLELSTRASSPSPAQHSASEEPTQE